MFSIVIEIHNVDENIVLTYFDLLFTFLKNVNINDKYINRIGKMLLPYNNLLINYPYYFVLFLEKLYTLTLESAIPLIIIENYLWFSIAHLFEYFQGHIKIIQLMFLIKCDILITKKQFKLLYSELHECEISLELIHLIISLAFNDKKERNVFINTFQKKDSSIISNNNHSENLRVDNDNNNIQKHSAFKLPIYKHIKDLEFYKDLLQVCIDLLTIHNNEYYFNNEIDNKEIFISCYTFLFTLFQEIIQFAYTSKINKEHTLVCSCFSIRHSLYGELVKYFISTYTDDIHQVINDILSITDIVLLKCENPFVFDTLNEINKDNSDSWENIFKKIMSTLFEHKKEKKISLYIDSASFVIENIANLFYFIINNLSNNSDNNIKIYFEKELNIKHFLEKTKIVLKGECLLYINAFFKNTQYISNQNNTIYGYTYKTIAELYFDVLITLYTDLVYDIKSNFYIMLINHIQSIFILIDNNANRKIEDFKKGYIAFALMDSDKFIRKIGIDKQKINKIEYRLRHKMINHGLHSFDFLLKILLCYIAYENYGDLQYLFEEMSLITVYNVLTIRKESIKFPLFEDVLPKIKKKDNKKLLKLLGKTLDQFFISEFSISITEEQLKELLFIKFKVIFKDNFVSKMNREVETIFQDEDDLFSNNNSSDRNVKYNSVNSFGLTTRQSSSNFTTRPFEIRDDDFSKQLKLFIKELTFEEIKDNKDTLSIPNEHNIYRSSQTLNNKEMNIGNCSLYKKNNTSFNLNKGSINNKINIQSLSLKNSLIDKLQDENSNNNINSSLLNKKQYGNYFHYEKIYSFERIDKSYSLFYPKRQLLMNIFSLFFNYQYFHNDTFIKMKLYYNNLNPQMKSSKHMKILNYPSTIKNYSNENEPPLFLKQNFSFFESPFFTVSHQYFLNQRNLLLHPVNQFKLNKIDLYKKPLPNLSGRHPKGVLITPLYNKYMIITFEDNAIILKEDINEQSFTKGNFDYILHDYPNQSSSSSSSKKLSKKLFFNIEHKVKSNKVSILFYDEIHLIITRRYLLQWQAVEIFMKNGKNYFINLYTNQKAKEFITRAIKYGITVIQKEDIEQQFNNYTNKWNNNEINTYQYLIKINHLGTRTYRDPNQYPIFPWLLRNYTDIFKQLNNYSFRDFTYPVSCQSESKRLESKSKYIDLIGGPKWQSHFGSHYSTAAFVYYYLMRTYPFCNCLIELQNYGLENSNRMFYSIIETQELLETTCDSRELIPEMFSSVHNLINLNCVLFGTRKINEFVDDIIFSELYQYNNISRYVKFIIEHQQLLNHTSLNNEITKWIDYVFGYRQLLREADSCVIFQKHSYEQAMNLNAKIEKLKRKYADNDKIIMDKIRMKINIIINFGMTPYQIYTDNRFKNNIRKKPTNNNSNEQLFTSTQEYLQKVGNNSILFFTISNKNDVSMCIVSPIIQNLKPNIQIQIFSLNTQIKPVNDISILIKPFQYYTLNTIKSSLESSQAFIYFIHEQTYYFIITRYSDCSIHLLSKQTKNKKEIIKKCITESFVTCICKGQEQFFYTGMQNGKLIQWLLSYNDHSIKQIRSIYAQLSPISTIYYYHNQKVIITSGSVYKNYDGKYESNKENNIYIRKAYDFELLTPIELNPKEKALCIKVSQFNFIYVLLYYSSLKKIDSTIQLVEYTKIVGYTLSGIKFAESCEGEYSNFTLSNKGNIIVSDKCKLKILCGACLNEKFSHNYNSKIMWIDYDNVNHVLYMIKENKEWDVFELKKLNVGGCRCKI